MEIVLKRQKLSAPLDTSVYQNLKLVFIHYCILNSPSVRHYSPQYLAPHSQPSVLTSCCWWSGTRDCWLIVILKGFIYLFPISQDCKQSDNWLFLPARAGRLVSSVSRKIIYCMYTFLHYTSNYQAWYCQHSHEILLYRANNKYNSNLDLTFTKYNSQILIKTFKELKKWQCISHYHIFSLCQDMHNV